MSVTQPQRKCLDHSPSPHVWGPLQRKSRKVFRAACWRGQNKTVSSGYDSAIICIKLQHLWLPTQDQYTQYSSIEEVGHPNFPP